MSFDPQIISYAKNIVQAKNMRELNLVRGEAD